MTDNPTLKKIWPGAFLPAHPVGPGMPFFLRAVEEHASQALESLRTDVLPLYRSYRDGT